MGIFDKKPEVSMTGTEYIKYMEYKKKNKKKLTMNQKQAGVIFLFCFFGILVVIGLVEHLTYTPPPQGVVSDWYDAAPSISKLSWNGIGKVFLVYSAPILVFILGLSWILHGVQLRLLA